MPPDTFLFINSGNNKIFFITPSQQFNCLLIMLLLINDLPSVLLYMGWTTCAVINGSPLPPPQPGQRFFDCLPKLLTNTFHSYFSKTHIIIIFAFDLKQFLIFFSSIKPEQKRRGTVAFFSFS